MPSEPMRQFQCPNGLAIWNAPGALQETRFIYKEIFEDRSYEKYGVAVRDGDVVFDVGANVGMFTLSLAERFHDLEIFCFEPVPGTRACLARNIEQFVSTGRGNKVTILDVGLGASEAETFIEYFPSAPGNSTLYSDEKRREFAGIADGVSMADAWKSNKGSAVFLALIYPFRKRFLKRAFGKLLASPERLPCSIRTLSSVIRSTAVDRIDLLKIDVEGAELDVLAGIEDEHWPLIRQIAAEVAPANKDRLPPLFDRLRGLGFGEPAVESLLTKDSRLDAAGPCNIYAVRKSEAARV